MRKITLQNIRKSLSALTILSFMLAPTGFALATFAPVALADTTDATTVAATNVTSTDATMNGTVGATNADNTGFWVATSSFSTTDPTTLPSGVYSTGALPSVLAGAAFSAQLSTVSGILPITADTTYYYAAWTDVGGTWSPGAVMSFTTVSAPTITDVSPASGPTAGSTAITITGTQFQDGATVTVGGTSATSIVVVSDTSITAMTPAGTAGAQDVVVTNPDAGTVTATGGFTYTAPVADPAAPTTMPATTVTPSDATLNGMNGNTDATDSMFWVSTSTITTPPPTGSANAPDGVYATSDFGAQAANAAFSAPLSSLTGLLPVTPSTTYYFVAYTYANGTWSPGAVLQFTTAAAGTGNIGGTITGSGALAVDSIDAVDTSGTADNSYADGWSYVFHVTLPTNETNVAMQFSDWMSGANTMPVAGNMRISSAQADNGGAPITVSAADTYTTPDLHMITDLDPATPGIQVDLNVEVKIPIGSANDSYTTNYALRSE